MNVLKIIQNFISWLPKGLDCLGKQVVEGSPITLGIPIGISIIIMAFILTGIYVGRANKVFDEINQQIIDEAKQ